MSAPNPYAPPRAFVSDEPLMPPGEPASRAARLGAILVDALLYLLVILPSVAGVAMERAAAEGGGGLAAGLGGLLTLAAALTVLISHLVLLNRNGQTLGKRLMGIRIVRSNGGRASLARLFFLRGLALGLPACIPYLGWLYLLVDSLAIFGESRRCVHDRIAGTIVVKAGTGA